MTDYAQLAQSLKDNEAFQRALDNIRANALETLVLANATDPTQIIGLQATVKVVDNFRDNLEQFIRSAAQAQKKPGLP